VSVDWYSQEYKRHDTSCDATCKGLCCCPDQGVGVKILKREHMMSLVGLHKKQHPYP